MILFGIHVPKCAGTTLFLRARSQLQFNEVYSCTDLARNFAENRMELLHINNYSTLRLVFGHFLHEEMLKILPGPVGMFVGLREPHARLKSELRFLANYRKRRGLPPTNMKEEINLASNIMCYSIVARFPTLAGKGTLAERALRVLEHCWCVYFTERFEETAAPIFQTLHIRPDKTNWNMGSDQDNPVDMDMIDLSGARLDQDMILYEAAMERYSVRTEISSSAAANLESFRAKPLRRELLQQRFYGDSFQQYRDDNVLQDVIRRRQSLIADLQAELKVYAKLMAQQPVDQS